MSYDAHVDLIIGAPLLELGTIEEGREVKSVTNTLGVPTGKKVILRSVYFKALNGKRVLIGTNEWSITKGYPQDYVDYTFDKEDGKGSLREELSLEDNWIHYNGGGEPKEVIIGLIIEGYKPDSSSRLEELSIIKVNNIDTRPAKAMLKDRFGYEGELYVIAMGGCG